MNSATTLKARVEDWAGGEVGIGDNGCNAGDWTHEENCIKPIEPTSPFEGLLHTIFSRINTVRLDRMMRSRRLWISRYKVEANIRAVQKRAW
jgi:hypothetical protein